MCSLEAPRSVHRTSSNSRTNRQQTLTVSPTGPLAGGADRDLRLDSIHHLLDAVLPGQLRQPDPGRRQLPAPRQLPLHHDHHSPDRLHQQRHQSAHLRHHVEEVPAQLLRVLRLPAVRAPAPAAVELRPDEHQVVGRRPPPERGVPRPEGPPPPARQERSRPALQVRNVRRAKADSGSPSRGGTQLHTVALSWYLAGRWVGICWSGDGPVLSVCGDENAPVRAITERIPGDTPE